MDRSTRHLTGASAALPLLTTFLLIGACGSEGGEARPVDAARGPAQEPEEQVVDLASLGFDEGDDDAALFGVVEFSDFGCVFCAGFHQETYPALHTEFVESGEVLWKYIPITIGGFPNGQLAGLAGICGGFLGEFAGVRDLLYETREEWMEAEEGDVATFLDYAASVGLERAGFEACLESEEAAEELAINDAIARQIGVTGTPTFIVRGMPVQGAPPLDAFREALQGLLDEARLESQGN
jgi:protein-disulfide isomerase